MNIIRKLSQGDVRTVKANKNALLSMVFKGIDALSQFILVPVTLGFLNPYEYGIWLTLNSILVWINSFDIGLGNGLRNQLANAVAKNDYKLAKSLVSTAFIMIAVIMLIIMILGGIIIVNTDWYAVLNASNESVPNLPKVVYVSFALFCVNFMMKFVGNVYLAMQMPAINNLLVTMGHVLSLIIIFILTLTTGGSLLLVSFVFSISPVIVYVCAYPITFNIVYRQLKPEIGLYRQEHLKSLFNVGILFFLLQISGVVLFAMSNIIISKLLGPDQVTSYNISYRYFTLVNLLLSILVQPIWTAVTDAQARGDNEWISNSVKKTKKLLLLLGGVLVVMLFLSGLVYRIWLGSGITIPFELSCLIALYVLITITSTAFSYFLNGMGKLFVQILNTVIIAILFFPLCWLMGILYGIYGVVCAMCLLNMSGALLNYIQVKKLTNNSATGIWNK